MGQNPMLKLLAGRTPCPKCRAANLEKNTVCFSCGANLTTANQLGKPAWGAVANARAAIANSTTTGGKQTRKTPRPKKATTTKQATIGGKRNRNILPANQPKHYEAIAYGKPITQGSMRPGRGGRLEHEHAEELFAWRQMIEDAFRTIYETPGFVPIDQPVIVEAIFTVERPSNLPADLICYPDTKPDADKLQRGLGDSLSPSKTRKVANKSRYFGKDRFRLLNEDSRIVRWVSDKTYPAPLHTHPGALSKPGVRVRVIVLDPNPTPLPMPHEP